MPEPIKWKSKIILVKAEATYGVDPTPTGALNAMLLTDVAFQPMEGEDVSRNLETPYLGAQEDLPTGFRAVLTGSFELVGSGTAGTAPQWSPLLRACAVAEVIAVGTKVEYTPISDSHESVAIYFQIGPSRHVLLGARGTAVVSVNAQGIPVCRVTLTGLFTTPSDQTRPTPVLTNFKIPQVASKANTPTFTIGGAGFVLRNYEFNLGNDVQPRLLIGTERIIIVDRSESLSVTVEAVPYATYNPFTIAANRARQAVQLIHGVGAGKIVTIDHGQAAQRRPTGLEQNQGVVEWPLGFTPMPTDAGNDQWKITLT